ncbi:lysozyme g [Coregonus clupeaformis]|uniref:lysozyme g n=1 Tax=Coregonus clupeaformis TaxID=59861 RepID=UPI001E1C8544|nr:lysozyme g [Coregonus clupeaformis]
MGSSDSRYGNIMEVETTGASKETAYADGHARGYKGVYASQRMAEYDKDDINNYIDIIKEVGEKYEIAPALICGIISRETRGGRLIRNPSPPIVPDQGWGDYGNGFGLMQVDVNPNGGNHKIIGKWDSKDHLAHATEILIDFIKIIQDKRPEWTTEQQLKGGIAAYNQGDGAIGSLYANVDENTTGKDYSNDVVARAQWYHNNLV